ncbi:hypothetical protein, partial [Halomonas cupida]|uniref:hypothetical protein n=1 Tax=Halomonas cupida TaxID=44933 RepID=UPI003A8CBBDD
FHGESGGRRAAGGSSVWDRRGKLLARAPEDREALAFAEISASGSRGWSSAPPRAWWPVLNETTSITGQICLAN